MPRDEGVGDTASRYRSRSTLSSENECPARKGRETIIIANAPIILQLVRTNVPRCRGWRLRSPSRPDVAENACENECPAMKGLETQPRGIAPRGLVAVRTNAP